MAVMIENEQLTIGRAQYSPRESGEDVAEIDEYIVPAWGTASGSFGVYQQLDGTVYESIGWAHTSPLGVCFCTLPFQMKK
jgi:hypothetical protein